MRIMRKRLALLLALAMVLSLGVIPALAAPETTMEETVLVDNDELSVKVVSFDPNGNWGPVFELLLENKSDRALYFNADGVAVDGIMCDPFWGESVPAGTSAYSNMSWDTEDLEEVGINYVQNVNATLSVYDDDTFEDVYEGEVAWAVDVGETDVPATEPVVFDHGFAPQEILTGEDLVFSVMDYDPAGGMDGGPQLIFYMENHTDRTVYFTIENVSVNGVVCDPYWAQTVSPGMASYSACDWWMDDLEKAHVEQVETVAFTVEAEDDDTFEDLASSAVNLDLASGGATVVTADTEAPAADTEAPAAESGAIVLDGEAAALMGAVNENVYTNEYFGLSFAPTEDWRFYTQEELLEQQGLAAEAFDGTEIGEDVETFMNSESGFSVMMAEKEGGIQNVNLLVENLGGISQYLSESDLLSLVMQEMGLDESGDMTAMGLEGATLTKNTFTFAGTEHEGMRIEYTDTSMGIELPMYLQMVFLMQDDYVLQITMTTVFEDQTADIGAMFSVAEAE